jgi:hypothetical protein
MLSMLIREQIGAVLADGPPGEPGSAAAYRRMVGDPLQKLQRLLGHASVTSTYIYLDSLEESRALVEAAAERWSEALDTSMSMREWQKGELSSSRDGRAEASWNTSLRDTGRGRQARCCHP